MDMGQWLGIYLGALVLLFLLRKVLGLFVSAVAFTAATLAYMKVGFDPPVPGSVVVMYGVTLVLAVLLYVSASANAREAFFGPWRRVLVERKLFIPRVLVFYLAVPALVAWQSYQASIPSEQPPPRVRSVHPSPPNTINFHWAGDAQAHDAVDLIGGENPLRELQISDPEAYAEKVKRGKTVYYQNCYYCHGDHMMADGHYAAAVQPPPASFQDPGTIAMLQETYLFWRIAKGGPGLPDAGTPWDSSMPVWEKMLSWDDHWAVILFLYDYTGYQPRGRTDIGQGGH